MRKLYISFVSAFLFILILNNKVTAQCSQNFDGVVAPALPAGWTTDVTGIGIPFTTSTVNPFSAPNAAFGPETSNVGVTNLYSDLIPISSPTATVSFRNSFNLENIFDGMVLEIAIGAGPYQDILAAGGSFVTGGYNGTLSVNFGNPLPGRQAWTGLSGGTSGAPAYITTTVNLPAAANGQNIRLRWRVGSDNSFMNTGLPGARIDNITFTGCTVPVVPCAENFDGVTVPNLPGGWIATTAVDCATSNPWATVISPFDSAPNSAFVSDPSCVSDERLDSRPFVIISNTAQLIFRRNIDLESGFDGLVLEVSVNGGPFQDIITAGGTFVNGGYNGSISVSFSNPIAGRQAWTGNSAGWQTTTIDLPASMNGQTIVLRWRRGSDSSVSDVGAAIDNISITGSDCAGGCAGIPVAGTISGPATTCTGNPVNLTLNGYTALPGITIQWKSSTVPGGPYTNIPGATNPVYNFNATPGNKYFIATVTCTNGGASANTPEFALVVGTPVHSAVSSTVTTACSPGAATVTGTVTGGVLQGVAVLGTSGAINLAIPDNNTTGVNTTIVLPATTFTNAADLRIRINARHSWVGDLKFTLTSPCGTTFLFDRPGVPASGFGNSSNLGTTNATTPPPAVYTFDLAGATVIPETSVPAGFIAAGTYLPSDIGGAAHNWAGLTFPCSGAGNWTLNISDNAGGDTGALIDWQILGPSVYTHTLAGGPGTITQDPSTGPGNSTANFTLTNVPFGTHTYVLTSTDGIGCSVSSNVSVTIKQTPVITFAPPAATICNGAIQQITASVVPPITQTFAQIGTTQVPGGQPGNTSGPGSPYPSTISVSGLPTSGPVVRSVKLGNINHTFPDDIDVVLVSPAGTPVILMSDAGGGVDAVGADYVLDDAAAALLADNALSPSGTYRPTNYGTPDAFVAPGPGSVSQANPTLSSFGAGNHNGTWSLYIVDDVGGDIGYVGNWSITFDIPPTVIFSPITGLYTNPAATIPYTGTPINVVYAKPATTTVYTATSTVNGCTGSNTITITVNQPPAITVQPAPATQNVCPGFNVSYSVTATGTGLTYQWRRNAVNLTDGGSYSGTTTSTLNITNVTAANSGTYTVVVSGTCAPPATSNGAVLNVATTPVISAHPANTVKCVGQTATFTVGTTGSVPAPNIFQWQVSTNGGVSWTNLTTGGSYTATLTVANVTLAMNNNQYRVIVTNFCGQTITSNAAVLTVTNPNVTAAPLSKICLSDTLVTLVGTPVGGTWSGIGVSGFNFVPSATAVGTYTLTYTYTDPLGCVSSATTIAKVEDCPERIRLLRDDAVILYPNPNNGQFNIRMNSTLYNFLGMRVYTTGGQLLMVKDWGGLVYGRVLPVDLTHLPSGTYMVKLYYDDGVRSSERTFPVIIGRD